MGRLSSAALIARDRAVVSPAIYRYTDLVFIKGEGVYLIDPEGRRYLDFAAGIATMNVGHSHPKVVEAICQQARLLVHAAAHVGYMEPYVELAEALRRHAPDELQEGKVLLMNSGSEAVESGIKLARYVTGRPLILAFLDSFHGRPMGALAATASNALYRRHLASLLPGVIHAPYPYCYRCPLGHETADACGMACLKYIEKLFKTILPPEDLAGILVEPIAGEGGYIVPPADFLPTLRQICDRYGALLIADEVQTGLGRTGKMFACQHWGVVPDIICLGKAIGGGLPLGGVLAKAKVMDQWPPAAQGSTFGGNPVACRAGLATLQVVLEEGLMENAVVVGQAIQGWFREAQRSLPVIGDVRGKGLMIGVELIKPDGQPAADTIRGLIKEMGNHGVVLTKCGESTIRISPPLILTMEQAKEGVDKILSVLKVLV